MSQSGDPNKDKGRGKGKDRGKGKGRGKGRGRGSGQNNPPAFSMWYHAFQVYEPFIFTQIR